MISNGVVESRDTSLPPISLQSFLKSLRSSLLVDICLLFYQFWSKTCFESISKCLQSLHAHYKWGTAWVESESLPDRPSSESDRGRSLKDPCTQNNLRTYMRSKNMHLSHCQDMIQLLLWVHELLK